ncbi:MAG TPA: hypothetical protein VM141_13725 [Planctomycetota bacterium]|nr:hypothetical protein [Planctomycetota bacterium]
MTILKLLDLLSLSGMALGAGFIMQPWWAEGFRVGFLVIGVFTLLYIVASHLRKPESP